jgi:hypothetical protein
MIVSQDSVKLVGELPELQLHAGDVGIVRKSWHYPTVAFEVEFVRGPTPVSVLLFEEQIVSTEDRCIEALSEALHPQHFAP